MATNMDADSVRGDERGYLGQAAPPPVTPPAPPQGGIVARVQRMPLSGRWALGLGLAFLSGVAILLLQAFGSSGVSSTGEFRMTPAVAFSMVMTSVAVAVAGILALAAGIVLTRWLATLALAAAAAVGGYVGSLLYVQVSPSSGQSGTGFATLAFLIFVLLYLGPLIALLFAGVGLGKWQGLTLGQIHARSTGEARFSQQVAALGLVVAGGYLIPQLANMPGLISMQTTSSDVVSLLPGILYALVLSTTCLLAGWVLRSWWAVAAIPVGYVIVAILAAQRFTAAGGNWLLGFLLYVFLPAIVMSAIGVAIVRPHMRQPRQGPHSTQLAT